MATLYDSLKGYASGMGITLPSQLPAGVTFGTDLFAKTRNLPYPTGSNMSMQPQMSTVADNNAAALANVKPTATNAPVISSPQAQTQVSTKTSSFTSDEQKLAQMRAEGKTLSNSKSYASLYNKIKKSGGNTEADLGGTTSAPADTAKNYITDLTNQYKQAIAGLTPLPQVYQGIESNLGIPALQSAANNLSATIANLPQTSLARAQRYDLSTPQMQEYQAAEAGRLSPIASSTYGALTGAQQEAANQLANVQTQYQTQLAPYTMAAQLAPEYTNILSGIQSQNAAQQLQAQKAQQDLGYLQQQYQLAGAQPITIGDYLIDPRTGKTLGYYKSSTAATSPTPTLTTGGPVPTTAAGASDWVKLS